MNEAKIIKFANEIGYEDIKYWKDWQGYQCYFPIWALTQVIANEFRQVILVKDDEIRLATFEEAIQLFL